MIYGKMYARKARMWKNFDGEFGQITGWLLKVPYMAFGGMTAINKPVAEFHEEALLATRFDALFIRIFGKKVADKEIHGRTLYGFGQHFYRLE